MYLFILFIFLYTYMLIRVFILLIYFYLRLMAGGSVKFVTHRKGTWADSETETCLKTLLTFARSHGVAGVGAGRRELLDYGQLHVKLFDALKKEFKCLRSVWMLLKEQVRASAW